MLQTLITWQSSAYVEIGILALLLVLFFKQRRDPRLVASGIRLVRTIIIIAIFSYFAFIWASTVQPTLRTISVFGMFLVNLYFLYIIIMGLLERPFRDTLDGLNQEPRKPDILQEVWRAGKRFYYLRYFTEALFSGINPITFLKNIATGRVREDIKITLRQVGIEKRLISWNLLVRFMRQRLECDENLPADFKTVMAKTIDELSMHPWIEEQINDFLQIATESPEVFHFPEEMAALEKCANGV